MKRAALLMPLSLMAVFWMVGQRTANAQASPSATQTLRLSAFGGLTGTYTGLSSGRNAAITVGGDLGFLPIGHFYPSLEFRSTYVFDAGSVDGQKNVLGGLKVEGSFRRLHPYGNLLIGRGSINYGNGYQVPDRPIFYTESHGNVISPGGGIDFDLTHHFALKLEGQYQRYATPVTTSGHIYAKSGTIGIVYRFDFNKR